jgi:hypothetical protein
VLTIEEEEEEERSNWSSETEKKQFGLRSSKQRNKKQKQNGSNLESKTEPIWSSKQNMQKQSSSNWTLEQIFFFLSFSFLRIEDEAIVMKQNQLHYGVYVFLSAFCFWWN